MFVIFGVFTVYGIFKVTVIAFQAGPVWWFGYPGHSIQNALSEQ